MRSVETALDVALIVMENGGSTAMADRAFRNILKGFGQEGFQAAWRLDLVTVSGEADGRPLTVLRPIGKIGTNLARVSEAVVLGQRAAKGEVDAGVLPAEVEHVRAVAPPYGRWTVLAAAASVSAIISRLSGGDWGAFGIAFAAAAIGQFVRSLPGARKIAVAPLTLFCGIISTGLAAIALRLGGSPMIQATLIASAFYMVPGPPLINGFVDMVSHKHMVVGLERLVNATFLCLMLAVAIAFAYTAVL